MYQTLFLFYAKRMKNKESRKIAFLKWMAYKVKSVHYSNIELMDRSLEKIVEY